jgi:ribosome-associated heat shock protein Hsp15
VSPRFVLGFFLISADHSRVVEETRMSQSEQPDPAGAPGAVRLDLWLWAVRFFKTRSQAAEACRLGRVTRGDGDPVKPSRLVRLADEFCLHEDFLRRRVRVDRLLHRRVGAKLAGGYFTDLTPAAEIEKARSLRVEQRLGTPVFVPGMGRPTKAQRRALEAWHQAGKGSAAENDDEAEAG